ncbi:hypothetical protein PG985_015130 [Apiospora marii]|uniref:uncharacterized protein n=1 Tax=Apiospora marii TaxID=335849 RepID=UPI00312ED9D8
MQFSISTVIAILAANALAGPVSLANTSKTNSTLSSRPYAMDIATHKSNETMAGEALLFAMKTEAACDIGSCAGVLAAAGCVGLSIWGGNPTDLVQCVDGGADKICGCASCIGPLGDFLAEHQVC